VGKIAKNLYPGFGDEITNLDCSKDGKWLLATCTNYLLVIPTFAKGVDGFKKRLGKVKPVPRKLTISPSDLARMRQRKLEFKNATFDDKKSHVQRFIVSSIG